MRSHCCAENILYDMASFVILLHVVMVFHAQSREIAVLNRSFVSEMLLLLVQLRAVADGKPGHTCKHGFKMWPFRNEMTATERF